MKDPGETNRWILSQKKRQKKTFTARSKHRTKGKSRLGKGLGKHKRKSTDEGSSPTVSKNQTTNEKKVLPFEN